MRKWISVIITLFLALNIMACGNGKERGQESNTVSNKEQMAQGSEASAAGEDSTEEGTSEALEIYYVSDDINSAKLVSAYRKDHPETNLNLVSFSDTEKMDQQIATVVNGGQGPDVILFPSNTSLDAAKMGRGNTFMDMTELLEADDGYDAANYYPVMDAGKVGGKQVYMPLRMQIQYFMSTEEKVQSRLNLTEKYSASELYQAFTVDVQNCVDEEMSMQMRSKQGYGEILYDNLRLAGVEILDFENAKICVDDELFQKYAEFSQTMSLDFDRSWQIMKKYSRDFVGGFSKLTAYWFTDSLPYNTRYYASIAKQHIDENIKILPFPNEKNAEEITADIVLYAAILESSDCIAEAYEFVRYAMDMPMASQKYDLSVNREVVQNLLDEVEATPGGSIKVAGVATVINHLSNELRTECEEILNRIALGSIRNGAFEAILVETMEPYILGEADFDSCYTKFKNQVEIYLYE